MQSPTPILDFSRSSSKIPTKQNLDMKQKKVDKSNSNTINDQTSEAKASNSGVTSFIYKITEFAAYTASTFTAITDTLAGGATEPVYSARKKSYNNDYNGDIMQINADDSDGAYYNDEISDGEIDTHKEEVTKKIDRKDESKWTVNDDEEEPPPPYDSSWTMPKTNPGANSLTDASMSTSQKRISFETPDVESKPTTPEDTNSATIPQTIPRRRQIRVRRPRKLFRKKSASTEVSTPRGGGGKCDDPEELLLKVNDKLSDMIAQGRAALTSTVDVTEVEMLLAEEKERDERIMKELGLHTPVGRKGRKNTSDYDYFNPISDGNYSSPEYFEYAYNDHGSGFVSPSGYDTPTYTSHGHYNTPIQFGSPTFQTQSGFNYSNLGYGINNKFVENDFNSIPNQFYGQSSSNGFGDPAIPKGFGAGPLSSGFGGPAKFGGRYGHNGSFGHGFGPSGRFGSNVFGSTGGHRANGMCHNREFSY